MTRVVPMMLSWIQKGEDGPRYVWRRTCPMIAQCSLALNHYSLLAEAQPIQLQSRVGKSGQKKDEEIIDLRLLVWRQGGRQAGRPTDQTRQTARTDNYKLQTTNKHKQNKQTNRQTDRQTSGKDQRVEETLKDQG
jgi:hypothetical protein